MSQFGNLTNFPVNHILREINFCKVKVSKSGLSNFKISECFLVVRTFWDFVTKNTQVRPLILCRGGRKMIFHLFLSLT